MIEVRRSDSRHSGEDIILLQKVKCRSYARIAGRRWEITLAEELRVWCRGWRARAKAGTHVVNSSHVNQYERLDVIWGGTPFPTSMAEVEAQT